jgi:hypothetical protein
VNNADEYQHHARVGFERRLECADKKAKCTLHVPILHFFAPRIGFSRFRMRARRRWFSNFAVRSDPGILNNPQIMACFQLQSCAR